MEKSGEYTERYGKDVEKNVENQASKAWIRGKK